MVAPAFSAIAMIGIFSTSQVASRALARLAGRRDDLHAVPWVVPPLVEVEAPLGLGLRFVGVRGEIRAT